MRLKLSLFAGLLSLAASQHAHAAEIVVTSAADDEIADAVTTLREAITLAEGNAEPDTILFDASLAGSTIDLALSADAATFGASAFVITSSITIDGGVGITLDAGATQRMFRVTSTGSLTLDAITLSRGRAQGFTSGTSMGNAGGAGGGGAGMGGAVLNEGTVVINGCTFTNNSALGGAGGQTTNGGSAGGAGGAGNSGDGAPALAGVAGGAGGAGGGGNGSDFGGGTGGAGSAIGAGGGGGAPAVPVGDRTAGGAGAVGGGGGGGGGGYGTQPGGGAGGSGGFGAGSGGMGSYGLNHALQGGQGGGGAGFGGAVFNLAGSVDIVNSTFALNTTAGGSAIVETGSQPGSGYGGAIFNYNGALNLLNTTIFNNQANVSGGVFSLCDGADTTVTVNNTIIAGSLSVEGAMPPPIDDYGFANLNAGNCSSAGVGNLIQTNHSSGFMGTFVSGTPNFGDLADNGGPTATHAPLSGPSPIIDGGNNDAAASLSVDQRGWMRVVGGTVDIGAIEIDTEAPTVTGITRSSANPTSASSIQFTVSFSEDVTGVETTDFSLTNTGTVTGSVESVVANSGTEYVVTVNEVGGDGTIRLDLTDDDSIEDGAGNTLGGEGPQNYESGEEYTVDTTPPEVVSITRVNDSPTNAASVSFTITFSESISGLDTTDFSSVTTGSVSANIASVDAATGTSAVVVIDSITGDGTLSVEFVDDDSVVDHVGNAIGGDGVDDSVAGELYTVDNTDPELVSIVRADDTPSNESAVAFTVTFSEDVTGVTAEDFSAVLGGTLQGTLAAPTPVSGSVYTISITSLSGDGTLALRFNDDDSIVDATSQPVGGAGDQGIESSESYAIDRVAPTVVSVVASDSSPTNSAAVTFEVTFSEDVTGVDSTDFELETTDSAGGAISAVTPSSATTYAVTVDTEVGVGDLTLGVVDDDSIIDGVGNPLEGDGVQTVAPEATYDVDRVPPQIVAIRRAGDEAADASSIVFVVEFSETVQNIDVTDFESVLTETATGSISEVSADSGSSVNVTVDSVAGTGTVTIAIADGNDISDAVGQALDSSTFTGADVFSAEEPPPPAKQKSKKKSDGGCNQTPASLFSLALAGLLIRRRRR